jgi:hypothetical protein
MTKLNTTESIGIGSVILGIAYVIGAIARYLWSNPEVILNIIVWTLAAYVIGRVLGDWVGNTKEEKR